MNTQQLLTNKLFFAVPLVLLLGGCAAGDAQFVQEEPADFWYGLWHGIISMIALIIHIFNDSVMVYEVNNNGGWYDFGFLLGVIFVWGGGCHMKCKSAEEKRRDQEWDEIGDKVEANENTEGTCEAEEFGWGNGSAACASAGCNVSAATGFRASIAFREDSITASKDPVTGPGTWQQ